MNTTGRTNMAMYGDLMVATDGANVSRSYLASEENYRVLKDLHERNMFVPVVGNFAGPKALRAVGRYLKERGATVTAFYLSNVEQYLYQDGLWTSFCANVASLPLDERSTFIRSRQGGGGGPGGGLVNDLGSMLAETKACGVPRPSRRRRRQRQNDAMRRRRVLAAGLIVALALGASSSSRAAQSAATLPARLSDAEFWKLVHHVLRAGRHVSLRQLRLQRGPVSARHS